MEGNCDVTCESSPSVPHRANFSDFSVYDNFCLRLANILVNGYIGQILSSETIHVVTGF